MGFTNVRVDRSGTDGEYATITLDNPAKRNALSLATMASSATSADGQEGIASFLEKRPPKWLGR